jgi:acetyl/propionyl-CoA carboxylase alpha subunit
MSTLGDKRSSKDYLRKHAPEVPLIPGFEGSSQNVEDLEVAARDIGFPVMVKASAGGGGKGIRIVREQAQLRGELERAQSEATRSFGSSDCILEKYVEEGKHIEIQIIGDNHGKVISLGERDCSVQRRHQKVIEETPCPLLTAEKRAEMGATAVRIGELIGYQGAGTVEFVFDVQQNTFYFLEVNARLQVEHPITEDVTGLDLVSLQLFVAAGGELASLPALGTVTQIGHAIECRLCAEDPQREFYPEHGKILLWKEAYQSEKEVRFETAVQTGSHVSIHFDSMIAKIVVWAPTRGLAIEKMAKILANTVCAGVKTNQLFLQSCLLHPAFQEPAYTTSFIQTNLKELLQNPYSTEAAGMQKLLSIVPALYMRQPARDILQATRPQPFSHIRKGFRNQYFDPIRFHSSIMTVAGASQDSESLAKDAMICLWEPSRVEGTASNKVRLGSVGGIARSAKKAPERSDVSAAEEVTSLYNAISNAIREEGLSSAPLYHIEASSCKTSIETANTSSSWLSASMEVSINGSKIIAHLAISNSNNSNASTLNANETQRVFCHFPALGTWTEYKHDSLLSYCEGLRKVTATLGGAQLKTVKAPMPCTVLSILKKDGDDVKAGESVMVVESMKMEMNISVMADGKFSTSLKKGDAVDEGKVLCEVV